MHYTSYCKLVSIKLKELRNDLFDVVIVIAHRKCAGCYLDILTGKRTGEKAHKQSKNLKK